MEFSVTLSNGVEMPRVGLGTWKIADEPTCLKAVKEAVSCGYKLIDTASVYNNEHFIGKALQELTAEDLKCSEVQHNDGKLQLPTLKTANGKGIFITSKAGPSEMGFENTMKACEDSLKRLQQDALDLYLIHWPGTAGAPSSEHNRRLRHESWRAMEALYRAGKVRAIGVSNFLVSHFEALVEDGIEIMPMVDQLEVHPMCPAIELRDYAKRHNIAIQAYSSLGRQQKELMEHPLLKRAAELDKRTKSEILLRWALENNLLVIPKSTNRDHLAENINCYNWSLSQGAKKELDSLVEETTQKAFRVCWNPISVL